MAPHARCCSLSPLGGSSDYDTCLYDCCVTDDESWCGGLAADANEDAELFEAELLADGRFVNVNDARPISDK